MPDLSIEINVSQFRRARDAIAMANDSKTWRGMFRDTVPTMLEELCDYAQEITHRRTGWLARSHVWSYDSHLMKGRIFINPQNVYLEGSQIRWPKVYGPYEHARGGSHAFYQRTVKEHGAAVAITGLSVGVRGIKWP